MRSMAACALTVLAVATTLAGCNRVYSTSALFSPADGAGAPILRPGLWTSSDPKCRFNEARPVQRWPGCAGWMLIRPGQVLNLDQGQDKAEWAATDYVLARGDPLVLQTRGHGPDDDAFLYYGLAPVRFDAEMQVVELEAWPALCGPPPPSPPKHRPAKQPAAAADSQERSVTLEPLSGLEVDTNRPTHSQDCLARQPGPVRASAAASRVWSGEPTSLHWVRDTLP